jgi:phage repressor protein C with HTH and peptisase S24 domain
MDQTDASGFGERLSEVIGDESVNSFAKRCEVSEGSVRNYLKDKVPGADIALRIADAAGVDFEWLVSGRGSKQRGGEGAAQPLSFESNTLVVERNSMSSEITLVPRLEVEASAGSGRLTQMEEAVDFIAFQSNWLRSMGISPMFARIISARGDSMESTIRDGDLLLIDTSVSEIRDNGIYCVVFGNMLLVKRVHARMNGSVQLISDNPHYPPEEVTAGEVDQINVAGRVMWFGRTI